jgi:hypothetical protein
MEGVHRARPVLPPFVLAWERRRLAGKFWISNAGGTPALPGDDRERTRMRIDQIRRFDPDSTADSTVA